MAVGSAADDALSSAKDAASQVGVSRVTPSARDRGYASLAERLTRSLVEELAELKAALPAVLYGTQAEMRVHDQDMRELTKQLLVEMQKMNAYMALITDEENPIC